MKLVFPKASEQTGISVHSLYKWRTGTEDEASETTVEGDVAPVEIAVAGEGDANLSQESNASLRKRYTAEVKGNALRMCEKIGITKASKETGITVNSLRKWRADAQNETARSSTAVEALVHEAAMEPCDSQNDAGSNSTAIVARLAKTSPEEAAPEEKYLPKVYENVQTDAKANDAGVPSTKFGREENAPIPDGKNTNADESVSEELIHLRIENSALKAQILSLKSALRVFTE